MAASDPTPDEFAGTPPLTPTVEQVLHKCGEHVGLVLETLVDSLQRHAPAGIFIGAQVNEQQLTGEVAMVDRPLLLALQVGRASQCGHCSPMGRMWVQSCSQSGSSLEGLMSPPRLDSGVEATSGSDTDIMFQLGPVRWVETQESSDGEDTRGADDEGDCRTIAESSGDASEPTVPGLIAIPTENPGFVMLLQERQTSCRHRERQCFTAESVRQLVYDYCMMTVESSDQLTPTGPATSFHTRRKNTIERDGFDIVPCLHASWWPSDEFFQRRRTYDWPPAAVRDDIKRFGIHLVPIGSKGSKTELDEWRLSFSRAEVVAAWHLTQTQLSSLVAAKICRKGIGPEGKVLKSYYLKTALFWLCQDTPSGHWKSMMQGIMMMMEYLEKAINDIYLPCFFWTGINLLRKSTPDELRAMRHTVCLMRRHGARLLAHELSRSLEDHLGVRLLLHPADGALSEDQVRACLAAHLVAQAAQLGLIGILMSSFRCDDDTLRLLLRSSAKEELAYSLHRGGHNSQVQVTMCRALLVAPVDVVAQCRLTSSGDGRFSWDAAPLVALLTHGDLQRVLGDPLAVSAWLEAQHRLPPEQRPDDLPADLSSPRAVTDLLLNPPLLARAIREGVPVMWGTLLRQTQQALFYKLKHQKKQLLPLADAKRLELEYCKDEQRIAYALHRRLGIDKQTALQRAICIGKSTRRFFADPRTGAEYNKIRCHLPDSWRLRQFVFAGPS